MVNDDDDVFTEATPLASKVHVVDYQIHHENNKPYYKIIRADEPKNFSDDFLLSTLKIMFEKPNVEANLILLVENKYPLTRFTLERMLNNVRLEVEKESKMLLELLRLVRRQLAKGYVPE
nr:hypothetical protein [Tanacetum cinerariifolium]